MIIIEGMDNSGKSTLASRISKKLDIPYHHNIKPESHDKFVQGFFLQLAGSWELRIQDRFSPISELVYGSVVRDKSVLEACHFKYLDMMLRGNHATIIYCRPKVETILNFKDRDQMEGVVEKSLILIKRYDWLMGVLEERYPENIIKYNYESDSRYNDVVIERAHDFKNQYNEHQKWIKTMDESYENLYKTSTGEFVK